MKYTAAAVGKGFWYLEFDKILGYKKKWISRSRFEKTTRGRKYIKYA